MHQHVNRTEAGEYLADESVYLVGLSHVRWDGEALDAEGLDVGAG
jgi:hypothetical protein